MHTADALAHVGDFVLDFSCHFESLHREAHWDPQTAFDASPIWCPAAMHLAAKEDMWLTLPQQIQFSQHLETTTKADTYILWGEKPSPQRKAYVATVLGLPLPLE